MPKIKWISDEEGKFYPPTIPQAVIDPTSGKSARVELDEKANHGYETEPKTLKQVDDEVIQLAGEVNHLKLTNLVVNGDFSQNITGWNASTGVTISHFNNECLRATFTQTGTFGGYTTINESGLKYIIASFRLSVDKVTTARIGNTIVEANFIANQWRILTGTTSEAGITRFYLAMNAGQYYDLDKVVVINTTPIFGLGNEPTKAEMDTLISILGIDYFEGEITVTQKQIMNWQLKLIRQNRNAIVALGGTII